MSSFSCKIGQPETHQMLHFIFQLSPVERLFWGNFRSCFCIIWLLLLQFTTNLYLVCILCTLTLGVDLRDLRRISVWSSHFRTSAGLRRRCIPGIGGVWRSPGVAVLKSMFPILDTRVVLPLNIARTLLRRLKWPSRLKSRTLVSGLTLLGADRGYSGDFCVGSTCSCD